MKKNKDKEPNALLKIYLNPGLRSVVEEGLDNPEKTYADIIAEVKLEFDQELTNATISRYKSARAEADKSGVDLQDLLDPNRRKKVVELNQIKRKKDGYAPTISEKNINRITGKTVDQYHNKAEKEYVSDVQVLDNIIKDFYATMAKFEDDEGEPFPVSIKDAIKAMEVKAKLTGNMMQGLSTEGIQELKVRQQAKSSAIASIVTKFVPKDQWSDVYQEMDDEEKRFYKQLSMDDFAKTLKESGVDVL